MHFKPFHVLAAFFLVGLLRAQAAPPITLQPGTHVSLIQRQITTKPAASVGMMTVTFEIPIELTVVRSDSTGTLIRWKRGVFALVDVDNPAIANNPALKAQILQSIRGQFTGLSGAMNNLAMDLLFDSDFQYSGLQNFDEIKIALGKTLDGVDAIRQAQGAPPLDRKVLDATFTKPVIEKSAAKEALLFLAPLNFHLDRGESHTVSVSMPSLLANGTPVPTTTEISAAKDLDPKGRLVVATVSRLDGEAMAKSLQATLNVIPGAKPLSPEDLAAAKQMQVTQTGEYHIDAATGFPASGKYTTTTQSPSMNQTESFEWNSIPAIPPAPPATTNP